MAGTVPAMDDWEIEHAGRTLVEAEEIRNNPKLFKAAKADLKKKAKAMGQVFAKDGGASSGKTTNSSGPAILDHIK